MHQPAEQEDGRKHADHDGRHGAAALQLGDQDQQHADRRIFRAIALAANGALEDFMAAIAERDLVFAPQLYDLKAQTHEQQSQQAGEYCGDGQAHGDFLCDGFDGICFLAGRHRPGRSTSTIEMTR